MTSPPRTFRAQSTMEQVLAHFKIVFFWAGPCTLKWTSQRGRAPGCPWGSLCKGGGLLPCWRASEDARRFPCRALWVFMGQSLWTPGLCSNQPKHVGKTSHSGESQCS